MSRSIKKGPFVAPELIKRVEEMNKTGEKKVLKTWSRSSTIFPSFVGLLKSAVANAENNFSMDTSKLYVSEVYATSGPILKRMIPASKGRGYRINKRTSHVTLAVAERD